jgi:uncharacterized membrane protein YphA (DoxX/SURF4 family)
MKRNAAATILRWGLAFVFFYAAVDSLLNPAAWAGYLPSFLTQSFSSGLLLTGFSVYEIVLAIWLFIGRKLRWSAIFAVVTLAAITVFNFSIFTVTFRDVGLAFAALALFELAPEKTAAESGAGAKEEELI